MNMSEFELGSDDDHEDTKLCLSLGKSMPKTLTTLLLCYREYFYYYSPPVAGESPGLGLHLQLQKVRVDRRKGLFKESI